jgi:hypothetical protein
MAFAACALLRTSMPLRTLYANLAAGTAAGASMSLVLLLSPLPTLVTVGAALGAYAAVAAATGLVRREDLRHLRLARGGSGRVIAPA